MPLSFFPLSYRRCMKDDDEIDDLRRERRGEEKGRIKKVFHNACVKETFFTGLFPRSQDF